MNAAVLVPVKAFATAKGRLAGALSPSERVELVRWSAAGVLRAAGEMRTYVVCDDDEVAAWASGLGAQVVWAEGLGLNGAVDHGVAHVSTAGHDHVVVVHADLPRPRPLAGFAAPNTITIVPDRRLDGTNLLAFPTDHALAASYGAGSYRRHLDAAMRAGIAVEVIRDPLLGLDVDHPADLLHPLVRPLVHEVLPAWQPTNPANPLRDR